MGWADEAQSRFGLRIREFSLFVSRARGLSRTRKRQFGTYSVLAPEIGNALAEQVLVKNGDPETIRTSDLQIRNLPLYPAELRGR